MSIGRALALLGAGMGGYAQGVEMKRRADNDQAEADFRAEQRTTMREQAARQKRLQDEQDALDARLKADAAPVMVQPELAPDQAGPQAWRAGAGAWTGAEAEAQQQAGVANSMPAVLRRQAATMQGAGKVLEADTRLKRAQELEKEGVLDALRGIRAAMPAPESITGTRAGFVSFDIPEDVRKNFDAQGKIKIPAGAVAQAYMRTLDDGTSIPDFRIVTGDGKRTVLESAAQVEGAIGMTLAERTKQAQADRKFKLDREDKLADNDRQRRRDESDAAYRDRMARVAERQARAAERQAAAAVQPQAAPMWHADADKRINDLYKTEDPTTGAKRFDSEGAEFARIVAQRATVRLGGDWNRAVDIAHREDQKHVTEAQRIAAESGGKVSPAAALTQLRENALKALLTPSAPPPKPLSPTGRAMAAAPAGTVVRTPQGEYVAPTAPAGAAYGSEGDQRMRMAAALKSNPQAVSPGLLPLPILRPPQQTR